MEKVPRIATPASKNQIVSSIDSAWRSIFGNQPTVKQVAMLYSQIAIETGHGKSIFNNNVGNINWTQGFPGNYYETQDSLTVGNNPANRKYYTAKMRAYNTLDDGILDYVKLLKNRSPVLAALKNGDVKDFSYALAAVHYYDPHIRDDYTDKNGKKVPGYTTGMTSIYKSFVGNNKNQPIKQEHKSNNLMVFLHRLSDFLDKLTSFGEVEEMKINKYGNAFPSIKYLISIDSNSDTTTKLEFARILSFALKEELQSISQIYSNNENIEIECIVNANEIKGTAALKELVVAVANTFEYATKSIEPIKIYTSVQINEKSHYQKLDIKLSEMNYRKFKLKFVGKK